MARFTRHTIFPNEMKHCWKHAPFAEPVTCNSTSWHNHQQYILMDGCQFRPFCKVSPNARWNSSTGLQSNHIRLKPADGACWGPRDSLSRLASWGIVVADLSGPHGFIPVQSGLLPGRFQSATRAELYAAIQAVRTAVRHKMLCRLWIDNQHVVRKIRLFSTCRDYTANENKPNHDLLRELHEALQQGVHLFREVVKVCSHQDLSTEHASFERWVFSGNQAADELATYEF